MVTPTKKNQLSVFALHVAGCWHGLFSMHVLKKSTETAKQKKIINLLVGGKRDNSGRKEKERERERSDGSLLF